VWGGESQQFSTGLRLGFVTAATSLTEGPPNFARCLAVSSANALYIHFRGLLPPDGILPGAEGATYVRLGGHHVEHWPTF